jgi:hypothetical protein
MPGYVAVALLESNAIRVDRPGGPPTPAVGRRDATPAIEDLRVIRSLSSEQLRERAASIRRIWRQTTFYLFDPDSWR